jgi:hypothetical protein
MQRYYQHLYDSDRQASMKKAGKPDSGTLTKSLIPDDASRLGNTPFSADSQDPGVFQPARPDSFSGAFDSAAGSSQPSPETVRSQEEQKEHLDSFKQLWDIDQPPAAPTVSAPVAPVVTTPLFATPQPVTPALNANFNSPVSALSSASAAPAAPAPTITSIRNTLPPRSTFAPPQRDF